VRALGALLALALDHPTIFVTANDKRLLRHVYPLWAPQLENWSRGHNRPTQARSEEKETLRGVIWETLAQEIGS
jgi:hypothetical protein